MMISGTGESITPELWGNEDGGYMFSSSSAFSVDGTDMDDDLTVSLIIAHWLEVADRIEQVNKNV